MLHLSLPLRPRSDVRSEYLLTPISISSEQSGRKILCLSTLKETDSTTKVASEYTEHLVTKLGHFDLVFKDSEPGFVQFALQLLRSELSPYIEVVKIRTCSCGAYEELAEARMFDLRRVSKGRCLFCNTELQEKNQQALLSDIILPPSTEFSSNRLWVSTDLNHFLARQAKKYKISKDKEPVKICFKEKEFGVRYQLLWSVMIVYLSQLNRDMDITLHYVHKIQDKVFFICALARIMCPNLRIHLKALPIVWLDESPVISECLPSQVKLLSKSLSTKRKELRVSLKSWRY